MNRITLATLLFLVGLLVVTYPLVSKVYYNYRVSEISSEITEGFQVSESAQINQYNQFVRQNNELNHSNETQSIEEPPVQSFEVEEPSLPDDADFTDAIATIEIPTLDIHYPIYADATLENMERGAGHVSGTSYPVGGNNTNSAIAAHSYSPYVEWFTNIDKLKKGDEIIINNYKETLHYRVTGGEIVWPNQTEVLRIRENKDMITLITCTVDAEKRIIVYAERSDETGEKISPPDNEPLATTFEKNEIDFLDRLKVLSESWILILLINVLGILFILRVKQLKK
ncbi:class C sortase [Phocicoccus pinnipedialis]|uniref:Sortase family protein n=1 Tax=Phocicoccus pinnipedialis TaxID=110845 RepID=A0A6V7R4P8_9BACL|nr:class C sortase [Jeotgalicoccus pinnipedialis]MBP1940019.1 sortase A [Jeotgalicoccus pinnipedialis]CAD2072033.1 hypothetical protein JEOPIN946_00231 [Jeotgalicoccus pinnipedialis]